MTAFLDNLKSPSFPSLNGEKYYRSDLPRIDVSAKNIWLEALASDDYKDKQGKNMLKTPSGKLCCLGVYCEVASIPETLVTGSYRDDDTNLMEHTSEMPAFGKGNETSSVLIPPGYAISYLEISDPESCTPWFDFNGDETVFVCQEQGPLSDVTGESLFAPVVRLNRQYSLPNLNDSGEFTFAQIADIIRYFL